MKRFLPRRARARLGLFAVTAVAAVGVTWGVTAAFAAPTTFIDLTTAGATHTVDGAIFTQGVGPAGTGQFDPFLTLSTNQDTEKGYNTTSASGEFDTFFGGSRTHPLLASAIPPENVGGTLYREFSLDANDQGSDDYMSIDQIKIFLSTSNNLTGYSDSGDGSTDGSFSSGSSTLIYNMDATDNEAVLMRSQALSSGSGQSDITVLVPDSLFPANCNYGNTSCDQWVYFYTAMGGLGTSTEGTGCSSGCNYNVTAGFEEWRTRLLPVVNVTKTVNTSIDRTYDWTVKKYVSDDGTCTNGFIDAQTAGTGLNIDVFNGSSKTVCWKIVSTRGDPTDTNRQLTGNITITNPTGDASFISEKVDAVLNNVTDLVDQGGISSAAVTCPFTFPHTIAAGASVTCTYTKSLSSSAAGTNTAHAILDNGTAPDLDYSSAAVPFDPSTGTINVTDATASLTDSRNLPGKPVALDGNTNPDTRTYTEDLSCGSSRTELNTATLTESDSQAVRTDPAYVNITCSGLSVTKDATPSYNRSYDWSVKKYVSLDGVTYQDASVDLTQFVGDSHYLYWKITPTRGDPTDSGFAVSGTITVHNTTSMDATGVAVSDSITGGITATVDCGSGATTVDVSANSTATCSYSATLPDKTTRTNTATATLFGVDYTGTASIDFTGVDPSSTEDATAHVTDDLNYGSPEAVTSGTSLSYTTTADCGDTRSIKNTATLTEDTTNQERTDDAQANITCVQLTVTKTATPKFARMWTWTVDKTSQDSALTLDLGQTFLEPYSVKYTATYSDSDFNVSGSITVSSPAGAPTRTVDVSDVYAANNATVDCGTTLPTSLAGGGTLNCTYSVDLGSAVNGDNVATATLTNVHADGSGGTTDFKSDPVGVTFSDPTTETDETVDISDTVPGGSYCTGNDTPIVGCTTALAGTGPPSGQITATPPSPFSKTFTYTRIIGPYDNGQCGDHLIDNTAMFTTTDTSTEGSDPNEITVTVPCPTGCTLTQGYWKTHSAKGPAPFDDNWNNIPTDPYAPGTWGGTAENTIFFYSGQTWYDVFWTAPKGGNAYYQLAHQYEAAVLNVLNGADASAVTSTLDSALALFSASANTPDAIGKLKGNDSLRAQFINLAGILGSYNTGQIGPGHCDEDSTSSSSP